MNNLNSILIQLYFVIVKLDIPDLPLLSSDEELVL